jgi:hypothetical protein
MNGPALDFNQKDHDRPSAVVDGLSFAFYPAFDAAADDVLPVVTAQT